MKRHLGLIFLFSAVFALPAAPSRAGTDASWIFQPSYYSHDPRTGQRTAQFAPPAPSYARCGENYQQSGFRHNEITLPGFGDADHIHVVETWGQGQAIRPYGEWLRPFRPGATPYGPWFGAQYPGAAGAGGWNGGYAPGMANAYGQGAFNAYGPGVANPYAPGVGSPYGPLPPPEPGFGGGAAGTAPPAASGPRAKAFGSVPTPPLPRLDEGR